MPVVIKKKSGETKVIDTGTTEDGSTVSRLPPDWDQQVCDTCGGRWLSHWYVQDCAEPGCLGTYLVPEACN